jgi:uncharacterized protein (TIGR03083 family)
MYDEYLDVLRAQAGAFAAACDGAPLDGAVPSCPEWTVLDLAKHMGSHHRWVTANVGRAPADGPASARGLPRPPEGGSLSSWIGEGAAALAERLAAAAPSQPSWTWIDDQTAAFWARRTAVETSIHRWDLENALGEPEPFAPALAADAIDEYLTIVPFNATAADGARGTVHLHTTDTDGEWLLRLGDTGVQVTREHAKGDVALRGPASDLLLAVTGRRPPSSVEIYGSESLFTRWRQTATF